MLIGLGGAGVAGSRHPSGTIPIGQLPGTLFLDGFMILGGIQHSVYVDLVAQLVPAWIPGRHVWTYLTGIALIAGDVDMLVPKTARLAALMSGIMMFLWVVLLHIPRLSPIWATSAKPRASSRPWL